MPTMHLQQALKSLCSKNGWCYAVFWKLKRRSQMMLTWEEGYYDQPKKGLGSCGGVPESRGNPLNRGVCGDLEGQISLAVAKMSYCVFPMGEGIVGRVAFTGKHKWVFHNVDVASGEMLDNRSMLKKYPEGWQGQFAAGIKTIAVIAVTQGVVQLGSAKLIKEDPEWVDHVKSVFSDLQATPSIVRSGMLSGVQGKPLTHSALSSTNNRYLTNAEDHCIDSSKIIGTGFMSATTQTGFNGILASKSFAKEDEEFSGIGISSGTCEQNILEIHKPLDTSSSTHFFTPEKYSIPIILQGNLGLKESFNPTRVNDEFATIYENTNNHVNSESTANDGEHKTSNSSNQIDNGTHELETFLSSFAPGKSFNWGIGDELSQALGLTFKQGEMEDLQRAKKLASSIISINFPENKSELLLDAVVGNASSSYQSASSSLADESFPKKTLYSNVPNGTSFLTTITETDTKVARHKSPVSTTKLQDVVQGHVLYNDPDVELSHWHQNLSLSNVSPSKGIIRGWEDEGQSLRSDDTQQSHSRNSEDRGGKKRSRSGDSSRPRPKDRQQIQDRVRELRDIVPSGLKCSIDALLEKTIKHMLFLQSVTLHAEQLKKNVELKGDIESGASWVLDQETRIPILVKDLKQPRQMLVEMICEENGLFLEIADIIRSLGLTILKGIMESHEDKVWAKFFVEANRDVQRVDVLLPLVQKLPLTNKNNISSMSIASKAAPK